MTPVLVQMIDRLVDQAMKGQPEHYGEFLRKNSYSNEARVYGSAVSKLIPCDHTASSFPLKCVEDTLRSSVYPYYSNTHSNNVFGMMMLSAVKDARMAVRRHVGASKEHSILFVGSGATGASNFLAQSLAAEGDLSDVTVVCTSAEHYSNVLPWMSRGAKVSVAKCSTAGIVDVVDLERRIAKSRSKGRKVIVSVCSASNVTGVFQPVDVVCQVSKRYGCLCFADCATSAPHSRPKMGDLDALFFSPHKIPGGQSTPGVLVARKEALRGLVFPGGGSVKSMSYNGMPMYHEDPERREGGTPDVIGIIKTAVVLGVQERFEGFVRTWEFRIGEAFRKKLGEASNANPKIQVLAPNAGAQRERIPIFAFRIAGMHYNMVVAILCDHYGITSRGGTSCTPYMLRNLIGKESFSPEDGEVSRSDQGWVRLTLSPIVRDMELDKIVEAISGVAGGEGKRLSKMYVYDPVRNVFSRKSGCTWIRSA